MREVPDGYKELASKTILTAFGSGELGYSDSVADEGVPGRVRSIGMRTDNGIMRLFDLLRLLERASAYGHAPGLKAGFEGARLSGA